MLKYKKSLFVVCFLIITSISVFSSNVYATTSNTANRDPNQAFTPQKDWSVASNQLNGTVMDICVDVSGNVILLVNSSDTYYIEKYNSNGTQIFSEKWNATLSSKSYPTAISTDYLNNIYIAGDFHNATCKHYEPFITKFKSDGTSIWNSSIFGFYNTASVTSDFYIKAIHIGLNYIDLLIFQKVVSNSGYTSGVYGYLLLTSSGAISKMNQMSSVVLLNGQFSATFFGNDSMFLANSFIGNSTLAISSYVHLRFWNSKDKLQFKDDYSPKNSPETYGVGVDNNSQIYVLGKNYLNSNIMNSNYLYAFNLTTGLPLLWNITTGTSYPDFSPVLSVLDSNHIYVAGVNVVSAQPVPYLERFNSNGSLIWTTNITTGPLPTKLIALDTDKFLYLGTYYSNNSNELSLITPKTNTNNNSTNNNNSISNLFKNIPGYNTVVLSVTIFATVGVIAVLTKRKRI